MKLPFKLSSILGVRKNDTGTVAETEAAIAAIIIRKEDEEALKEQIEGEGHIIDDRMESEDGVHVVYKQTDFEGEEVTAFRMNDDLCVLVTGVQKQFSPFLDSMSFGENFAAQGFMPSLTLGAEAMLDTVRTALRSSDDASQAKKNIGTVMKDFSAFTMQMIDGLPEVAFKQMIALEGIHVAKQRANPAGSPVGAAQSSTGMNALTDGGNQVCAAGSVWNSSLGRCTPTMLSEQIDDFITKADAIAADAAENAASNTDEDAVRVAKEKEEAEAAKKAAEGDDGNTGDDAGNTGDDDAAAVKLAEEEAAKKAAEADDTPLTRDDYNWDDPEYLAALKDVESIQKRGTSALDLGSILRPMPPRKVTEQKNEEEETTVVTKKEDGDGANDATSDDASGNEGGEDKILKAIAGLTEEVKEARKDTQALGKRVDEVDSKAKKAEDAVHGTVLSGSAIQDNTFGTRDQSTVQKSGDLWDGTALDRLVG